MTELCCQVGTWWPGDRPPPSTALYSSHKQNVIVQHFSTCLSHMYPTCTDRKRALVTHDVLGLGADEIRIFVTGRGPEFSENFLPNIYYAQYILCTHILCTWIYYAHFMVKWTPGVIITISQFVDMSTINGLTKVSLCVRFSVMS